MIWLLWGDHLIVLLWKSCLGDPVELFYFSTLNKEQWSDVQTKRDIQTAKLCREVEVGIYFINQLFSNNDKSGAFRDIKPYLTGTRSAQNTKLNGDCTKDLLKRWVLRAVLTVMIHSVSLQDGVYEYHSLGVRAQWAQVCSLAGEACRFWGTKCRSVLRKQFIEVICTLSRYLPCGCISAVVHLARQWSLLCAIGQWACIIFLPLGTLRKLAMERGPWKHLL